MHTNDIKHWDCAVCTQPAGSCFYCTTVTLPTALINLKRKLQFVCVLIDSADRHFTAEQFRQRGCGDEVTRMQWERMIWHKSANPKVNFKQKSGVKIYRVETEYDRPAGTQTFKMGQGRWGVPKTHCLSIRCWCVVKKACCLVWYSSQETQLRQRTSLVKESTLQLINLSLSTLSFK